MDFRIVIADGILRVKIDRDLDIARYPELRRALALAEEGLEPVLIELTETAEYCDSLSFSELLLFVRRMHTQRRRVAIHVVNPKIFRLLVTANLVERLHVFHDEKPALNALLNPPES